MKNILPILLCVLLFIAILILASHAFQHFHP